MKTVNSTSHSKKSKLDELRIELKNLRLSRKMNDLKICETKTRIKLTEQEAKADRLRSTVNKYQQEYYELTKQQTHNARIENRVALGVK